MCASVAFWSAMKIRGNKRWSAIDRWMTAFEERPSYMATKSDYYTHVQDIPPQYGNGYFASKPEVEAITSEILGNGDYWKLPLPPLSTVEIEPVSSFLDPGDEVSRLEAAWKLVSNRENIAKFALRGAGTPGRKQFQAPLADPYAVPALEYLDDMDALLRLLCLTLIEGNESVAEVVKQDKAENEETRQKLAVSLQYLRDRVGVPRDMRYPAARQLRAHINWIIDLL